jgi:hypothetical protein
VVQWGVPYILGLHCYNHSRALGERARAKSAITKLDGKKERERERERIFLG